MGQSLSSLSSTASQNLSAVSVRHALHEAMLLFSVQLLGLVRSFHVFSSSRLVGIPGHRVRKRRRFQSANALIPYYYNVFPGSCQVVFSVFFDSLICIKTTV